MNDAWNISAGDRLDGPISGGDGRYYNDGAGVENLTASSEGADLMVGDLMEEITFQYDSSAVSGSGSGSGGMTNVTVPSVAFHLLYIRLEHRKQHLHHQRTPTVESSIKPTRSRQS